MANKTDRNAQPSQRTVMKICLYPDEGQAAMQEQLCELAKEIAFCLSGLELSQSSQLLGVFVSELFLSVAESTVEKSRQEKRRQKQAEGIAAAKAKGVRFGPQPRDLPEDFEELRQAWRSKKISLKVAAELCGVPKTTFYDAAVRVETAASRAGTE